MRSEVNLCSRLKPTVKCVLRDVGEIYFCVSRFVVWSRLYNNGRTKRRRCLRLYRHVDHTAPVWKKSSIRPAVDWHGHRRRQRGRKTDSLEILHP